MNPYFKRINIIYMVLLASSLVMPMIFTGLLFVFEGEDPFIKFDKLIIFILIFISLADLFMSQFFYKLQTQKKIDSQSIIEKARTYQLAKIVQAGMMVFAANFAGVFLFMSGEKLFMVVFPLVWFLFVKSKPNPEQFVEDFQLAPDEEQAIFDRNFDVR